MPSSHVQRTQDEESKQQKLCTMKKMKFDQMVSIEAGGCGAAADKFIAVTGFIAGVASCFGPIGLAIAGPTALGMGIASIACAWK